MAVPKRRTSKSRRDKRRSHLHLTAPSFSTCPQCHEPRVSHRICPSCGYYKGKQVLVTEEV